MTYPAPRVLPPFLDRLVAAIVGGVFCFLHADLLAVVGAPRRGSRGAALIREAGFWRGLFACILGLLSVLLLVARWPPSFLVVVTLYLESKCEHVM